MIRYRKQPTAPEWPGWSQPNTEDPTMYIAVGKDGEFPGLTITRPAFDPEHADEDDGLWEIWEPAVDMVGGAIIRADEAHCRALAAAFQRAAIVLAGITAEDNDYPLEME